MRYEHEKESERSPPEGGHDTETSSRIFKD